MQDSIFTKIINGEIPCHKVYEDDKTIVFMDIHPIQPGHVLVVPKVQIEQFQDLPDDSYVALWNTVKKIALKQKDVLGSQRVGVQIIGVDVPHAHVHLVPFDTVEQYRKHPDMSAEPDHTALAAMAERLKIA